MKASHVAMNSFWIPALAPIGLMIVGCGHPFWNPAGAQAISHSEIRTLYYQTNVAQTKAFVFYSDHPLLIVGMATHSKWDEEAEKIAFSFAGVPRSEGNIQKYGKTFGPDYRVNDLNVTEFDIGLGVHGDSDDKLIVYYITAKGPWEHPIPFRGTIRETDLGKRISPRE